MARVHKMKQVKVEELRLLNFRSFENARLPLASNLTTIIGHNGSGKTTLLDAFDFVREALSLGLQVAINKRGGLQAIGQRGAYGIPRSPSVAVEMNLNGYKIIYGFSIEPNVVEPHIQNPRGFAVSREILSTADGRNTFSFDENGFRSSEKVGVANARSNGNDNGRQQTLLLPLLIDQNKVWREVYNTLLGIHAYTFMPSAIRAGNQVNNYSYLERDGGNASDILYNLQEQVRDEVNKQQGAEAMNLDEAENQLPAYEGQLELSEIWNDAMQMKINEVGARKAQLTANRSAIRASLPIGWIERQLNEIVPDLTYLRVGLTNDGRSIIYFQQHTSESANSEYLPFAAANMSDGTIRSLAILLALKQTPAPSMVLIDEIEDSIHPHALATIISAAYTSTENFQVVITTHSHQVLSYPSVAGEDVRVVEWLDGRNWVYNLHPKVLQVLSESRTVGDMLNRNTLRITDEPIIVDEDDFFSVENPKAHSSTEAAALWRLDENRLETFKKATADRNCRRLW